MSRVVIITGAASGLGLSLSQKFVKRGDIVYGATKTKRHWKSAKASISKPEKFILTQADVSLEGGVKRFLAKVGRHAGHVDIVINNAGYAGLPVATEKETLPEFLKNLSQNLLSAFLMCKHTLPLLKKQGGGWIVNISSMAGKRGVPRLAAYSAAKFGVLALTQCIAKENPGPNFKCVAVCPGGMNTQMRDKVFGDARRQQSPVFVADMILEILDGKIEVPTGGDILIRHGQVTAVNPPPEA